MWVSTCRAPSNPDQAPRGNLSYFHLNHCGPIFTPGSINSYWICSRWNPGLVSSGQRKITGYRCGHKLQQHVKSTCGKEKRNLSCLHNLFILFNPQSSKSASKFHQTQLNRSWFTSFFCILSGLMLILQQHIRNQGLWWIMGNILSITGLIFGDRLFELLSLRHRLCLNDVFSEITTKDKQAPGDKANLQGN